MQRNLGKGIKRGLLTTTQICKGDGGAFLPHLQLVRSWANGPKDAKTTPKLAVKEKKKQRRMVPHCLLLELHRTGRVRRPGAVCVGLPPARGLLDQYPSGLVQLLRGSPPLAEQRETKPMGQICFELYGEHCKPLKLRPAMDLGMLVFKRASDADKPPGDKVTPTEQPTTAQLPELNIIQPIAPVPNVKPPQIPSLNIGDADEQENWLDVIAQLKSLSNRMKSQEILDRLSDADFIKQPEKLSTFQGDVTAETVSEEAEEESEDGEEAGEGDGDAESEAKSVPKEPQEFGIYWTGDGERIEIAEKTLPEPDQGGYVSGEGVQLPAKTEKAPQQPGDDNVEPQE